MGIIDCRQCKKTFLCIFTFEWDSESENDLFERHSWSKFEFPLTTQGYLQSTKLFCYLIRLAHLKKWQNQGQLFRKVWKRFEGYHHLFTDLPNLSDELIQFMFTNTVVRGFDPSKEERPTPPHSNF
ncbi:MAG: hypothetical protein ACFFC7_14265 [Candidatus Hermodarchaeota archaeon]